MSLHSDEKISSVEKASQDGQEVKAESPTTDSRTVIDPEAERKLIRKLDLRLLPLFTLVYGANFIDRTGVGNAKIAGIEKDLGMKGYDYNIALTVFYILYILFDVPSNLMLKRYGSKWLAFMVVGFGVTTLGTAFVKNYGQLVVTRAFLGICEAGNLAGLTYVVSRYYRRHELVLRIGIYFAIATPLAGAFGGLLASGLLKIGDIGPIKTWRKIFFVEGIITTGIGLASFIILPTDPENTRMLTEEERALVLARIEAEQVVKRHGKREATTLSLVWRSLNINTTLCLIIYSCVNVSFQGLSLFLPTVIATLGHFSVVEAQLRTVPPFLVALVWSVFLCWVSFRIKSRSIPTFVSILFMVMGYAISIGTKNPHARYAACFLSLLGSTPIGPLVLAWTLDNAAPDTVRAVTSAVVTGFGTSGAVIAVWTYLPTDAPNYHNGNSLNLATACLALAVTVVAVVYMRGENAKRERGERDYRLEGKDRSGLEELGYLHPDFRYIY
ncbi:MFS general substrate transporter [Mycena kentingensis (nom. inval.)]|nr:MFS general substrate transporter [Mycena kentingensis (nom. inval.)]